jgi:hypothetical protein
MRAPHAPGKAVLSKSPGRNPRKHSILTKRTYKRNLPMPPPKALPQTCLLPLGGAQISPWRTVASTSQKIHPIKLQKRRADMQENNIQSSQGRHRGTGQFPSIHPSKKLPDLCCSFTCRKNFIQRGKGMVLPHRTNKKRYKIPCFYHLSRNQYVPELVSIGSRTKKRCTKFLFFHLLRTDM